MSNFIPNSFQVSNAIVDELLCMISGNATKLYLIIVRKTRGWNKQFDSISVSQFMQFSGIKKDTTVTNALKELINLDMIESLKKNGKTTTYKTKNHPQKTVPPKKEGTTKKGNTPPPKKDGATTPKKRGSTKDTTKTTNTKEKKSIKEIHKKIDLSELPKSIEVDAITEFIDWKIKKTKSFTQAQYSRAITKILKLADGLNMSPNWVIFKTIDSGWQGLGELSWYQNKMKVADTNQSIKNQKYETEGDLSWVN